MALEDPELREQSFRPRFGSTRVSAHSPHLPPDQAPTRGELLSTYSHLSIPSPMLQMRKLRPRKETR